MSSLKNKIPSIVLIFIFATATTLTINSITVKAANILQVPSANYPTIQSALNAANDGDTIKVAAGTYTGNIHYDNNYTTTRKTNIRLEGGGKENTIISGSVALFAFEALTIDGFKITGSLTLGNPHTPPGVVLISTITNNEVLQTTIIGGPNNKISNNILHGLVLKGGNSKMEWPTKNTTVEYNTIIGGLVITAGSSFNKISYNTITGGSVGIDAGEPSKLYYSTGGNTIFNNTIANAGVGISLQSSSGTVNMAVFHDPNTVTQNIIKNNNVGVEFVASLNQPVGNTLYHNDFISNGVQAKVNNPIANVWDDGQSPRKGNYWSDYTGLDGNGDGVGDTPYVVNAENKDNYPLMHPYSVPNAPTPTPTPSTTPSQSPSTSPSPSQSTQPQQPSTPTSTPTQTPLSIGTNQNSIVPELTPLIALAALVGVSLLALLFKRKATSTF